VKIFESTMSSLIICDVPYYERKLSEKLSLLPRLRLATTYRHLVGTSGKINVNLGIWANGILSKKWCVGLIRWFMMGPCERLLLTQHWAH
jgi:hypothetical protein